MGLLIIGFFWLLVGGWSSTVVADESVFSLTEQGRVSVGEQLTESERCQECHGKSGMSTDARIPNHAGQHAAYIVKQLKAFRAGDRHHEIMNRMAEELTDQDIADIAAYFSAQPTMRGEAGAGRANAKALFSHGDKARGIDSCASCHGDRGQGKIEKGVVYPRIGGQRRVYLSGQLVSWKLGDRSNSPEGVMNQTASHLTDDEIDALADYIAGL